MWFARMAVDPNTGCTAVAAVNAGGDAAPAPTNAAIAALLAD